MSEIGRLGEKRLNNSESAQPIALTATTGSEEQAGTDVET